MNIHLLRGRAMFYRFMLFTLFSVLLSTQAMAGKFEDAYGPKLYDIEKDKTSVRFVTKMCTADIIQGRFNEFYGQIYFDEFDPENSWVDVTLDTSSLSLDKEMHGNHIIKDVIEDVDILNIKKFTTIRLKSTKLERTGMNTGFMTADLTLLGETHPVKLEVTFENKMKDKYARKIDDGKVAFSAYGTFKRSEWNLLYGLDRVGIRRMGDEVQIFVTVTGKLHEEKEEKKEKEQ